MIAGGRSNTCTDPPKLFVASSVATVEDRESTVQGRSHRVKREALLCISVHPFVEKSVKNVCKTC